MSLLFAGITKETKERNKIKIYITNKIAILNAIFWLWHSYVFYKEFNGANYSYLIFLISALLFLQVLLLNYFEKAKLAQILLAILLPITIFTSSILTSISIDKKLSPLFYFAPQVTFMGFAVVMMFIFEEKNKLLNFGIFIFYILSMLAYLPLLSFYNNLDPNLDIIAVEVLYGFVFTIFFWFSMKIKSFIIKIIQTKDDVLKTINILNQNFLRKKEELEEANNHIKRLNKDLSTIRKHILENSENKEKRNKQIDEILEIARKTQELLLAPKPVFDKIFDYFIINRPVSTVSGDFFSIQKIDDNQFFFIFGDSTGHGISSAFISLMTINALRDIIYELKILEPVDIIQQTNTILQNSFPQSKDRNIKKVELAIVRLLKYQDYYELIYTGARMPLYIFKFYDNETVRLKPDPISIGSLSQMYKKLDFKETKLKLENKDMIYFISDGLSSQTNKEKKYGTKNIFRLIQRVARLPIENQKKIIEIEIDKLLKFNMQIDDILFVGIKLK